MSKPETLEEAIDHVAATVTPEQKAGIRPGAPRDYHFFGGMAIRNGLGLWQDTPLARHFKTRFGLGHADDMSGLIMDGAWAKLGGEAFDLEKEVAYYKTYWQRAGIDPLTQVRISEGEKNGGGIGWDGFNVAGATIRHQTPQPKRSFWSKLGDAIYGKR